MIDAVEQEQIGKDGGRQDITGCPMKIASQDMGKGRIPYIREGLERRMTDQTRPIRSPDLTVVLRCAVKEDAAVRRGWDEAARNDVRPRSSPAGVFTAEYKIARPVNVIKTPQ